MKNIGPEEYRLKTNLRVISAVYGAAKNLRMSSVSRYCSGNTLFLANLSDRNLRADTYDQVLQWFSNNWPEDTAWPETISRPMPLVTASRNTTNAEAVDAGRGRSAEELADAAE